MGIKILRLAKFTVSVPVLIRFITGGGSSVWWRGTLFMSQKTPKGRFLMLSGLMLTDAANALFFFTPEAVDKRTGPQPGVHFFAKISICFPPPPSSTYWLHNPGAQSKILDPAVKLCFWALVQWCSWEV